MQRSFSKNTYFLLSIIILSCSTTLETVKDYEVFSKPITIHFKQRKGDQSQQLQDIFDHNQHIILVLDHTGTYIVSDVIAAGLKYLQIDGNGSVFIVGKMKNTKSIITLVDPGKVIISNMTFSGNYPKKITKDYLLKIHTPLDLTKMINITNVNFINSGVGGLLIQNIYPTKKQYNYKAGAHQIIIKNCSVNNIGLRSGFQIRGSHRNVLFDGCYATDPLSRLDASMGVLFGISAEVQVKGDEVGTVIFNDCRINNTNKGFFVQKTKKVVFRNIQVDSMGYQPNLYSNGNKVGLVALKIDDLGRGNKAIIESFYVTNTAKSPYKYFLSIEETQKVGKSSNVIIKYFESDIGIRLGASGHHIIKGGILYKGAIRFQSSNNVISNVKFNYLSQEKAVEVLGKNNTIKSCRFYNSNIVLYKQAKQTSIIKCELVHTKTDKFVIIDLNDPKDPISIYIDKCKVPNNVLGLWSGGGKDFSTNLDLRITNSNNNFPLHSYIIENANIKRINKNKW